MKTHKPTQSRRIFFSLSLLFLSAVFSIGIYFVYSAWISMRDTAYLSCLASIANEIDKNKSTLLIKANDNWNILSVEESNKILSEIQPYDCPNTPNPLIDLWNNKIQIAVKKTDGGFKIIVWSKGSDGISHTNDDLVIPFGKKPSK